jgi:hypothetical protein
MFNLRLFGTSVEAADNLPIQLYARENEKEIKTWTTLPPE